MPLSNKKNLTQEVFQFCIPHGKLNFFDCTLMLLDLLYNL